MDLSVGVAVSVVDRGVVGMESESFPRGKIGNYGSSLSLIAPLW